MAKLDPPPFQSAVDTRGESLTSVWHQWFSAFFDYITRMPDFYDPYIISPSTGFNETIPDSTKVVTLDVPGTLASGTLTLPANPYDGQPMVISSTANVTSFSLLGNGATVKNLPATLVAGVGVSYYYRAANATWYRTY